jgi:sorbitol-specific phosphotransferase system component IIC
MLIVVYILQQYNMSEIDSTRKVHLIVHGQHELIEPVKLKLAAGKFLQENMRPASLDKAGEIGDYVAMLWPPMAPKEIVVSQITGTGSSDSGRGMGAWASIIQKELFRIPL